MSKALATKKVAAVLLGLGMVVAFATTASAQTTTTTTSDASSLAALQAQVQALLAQIASLQGTGTATTGSGACFTFTQDEWQGQTGGQVMWVQEFLNGHGFTVAASGAGSPGNETTYFGALTKAAVMNFQSSEGITPVSGYWGPLSRAKANAICAGSTTTTTTTTSTGTTVTNGAGITVTAGTQPANSLAPINASRVPFTTFTLTNNSSAAVTVNGVDVQLTGLANTGAFAGVELIDPNGVELGTSRTFNSNYQAEVGTPFTLNAGQSETFTVAANMPSSESSYAGQVASISVTGIDTTVPVSGTLPITGAQQTINGSLIIGSADLQRSSFDPISARTNESIGTTGLIFSGIRITNAGSAENEKLYSITWNQTGSVGSSDLSNLVTVVNGTSYPVTVDSTGRYYTATFPGGISIAEGASVDAYIQGDITGSDAAGRTVEFDIYRPSDIYIVGQTYGYGITPIATGSQSASAPASANNSEFYEPGYPTTTNPGTPFFEGAQVTITAGTLSTVGNAGSVGSQDIAVNVPNQPLGGFTTDFTGEPVTVQGITVSVTQSASSATSSADAIQTATLVDGNGNVVAGPVNEVGGVLNFNSSITFPVGAMTYTVKGTIESGATNGETYQLSTNPSTQWTSPQGEVSGATISNLPNTTITMSTMTVQAGALVISAASTPASTTVAPGASNFVIANINLDASQSGEDIRLNSLPIVINASSSNTTYLDELANSLTNCQLYNGSTALNTQSIGGTTGWTVGPTNETSGLEANFIFQNAITIPKGTVTTLSLECNVSSSIGTNPFSAGVNSNFTPSPTGVESGDSISATVQTGASGTMTPGSASLAVTVPTPISYAQVAGGTTGVTVGTFTLQPTSDSVNVQNIALAMNSNYASSSDISRVYIYNGATQVGSAIFTASPVSTLGGEYYLATSTINGLSLSQSAQTVLTIKADINQVGTGQAAMSGHEIRIGLDNAQGVGASSGKTVNSGAGTQPTTGVAIFRSYPTVASSSYLPSNGVADGRLIAFSITANANGPVGLDKLSFTISTTSANVSNAALYVYTDSGFSQPAGGGSNGQYGTTVQSGVGTSITTTFINNGPLEIPAGTTEYFLLKGTVSPLTSTYNVATTLLGDGTDLAPDMYATTTSNVSGQNFIWSPNSTTTSATASNDWTNGFGVSGLPSIGLTQNRTN